LAGPFSRYFMSQICCEIEATVAISALSLEIYGSGLCSQIGRNSGKFHFR
jgi:hypothetical protein